jgi:hypothetical protein
MATLIQLAAEEARITGLLALEQAIDCRQRVINYLAEQDIKIPIDIEAQFKNCFNSNRKSLEWIEAIKNNE